MRHLLLAGAIVISATTAHAQPSALPDAPINLTFIKAPLEDAVTSIARIAGVTIEFDATVTEEIRRAQLARQPLRLVNSTVEEAFAALTSMHGLTYTIIGPKAVRISKTP
jgi:hypothetical protein